MPTQSDTTAKLYAAIVKAQADMPHALKDARGQIGQNKNYRYADLVGVLDAIRPVLAANGLAFVQLAQPADSGVTIQTRIIHTSGEWISDGGLNMPAAKHDAQAYGCAATYARRYALTMIFGVGTDDDDGKSATAASHETLTAAQVETIGVLAEAAGQPVAAWKAKAARTPRVQWDNVLQAAVAAAAQATGYDEANVKALASTLTADDLRGALTADELPTTGAAA